jgi:flagellar biogenesis protein FliO
VFSLLRRSKPNTLPQFGAAACWSYVLQRFIPALRRRAAAHGALEHLGSLALTAQSSLALVRWQDRTLLLGVTPNSISLLTQGEAPPNLPPGVVAEERRL